MTPSLLILMVSINTILIKRCQSTCKMNTPSVMREVMATSSTLKLQGGLANEHDKSVVRALWVIGQKLILQHQLSLQVRQSPQHELDKCNHEARWPYPLNGKHQADQANSCPQSPRHKLPDQQKQAAKTSAVTMTHVPRVTHSTLTGKTAPVIQLAAPVTLSPTKQSKRKGRQQQIPS